MENKIDPQLLHFEHQYEILSYHCDPFTNLKVSSLALFMQEIAWLHSDKMEIGWRKLMENENCFWALTRIKVKMIDPPQWGDTITIKTCSRGTDSIQFFRDWRVYNQNGKLCAIGSSIWVIVDAETRHVQRRPEMADTLPLQGEPVFPDKLRKIKALNEPEFSDYSVIRYSELDVNRHMNNVSYLSRFLDEETSEFRADYRISEAELNFIQETTGGTLVRVGKEVDGDIRKYAIFRKRDNAELCRGKVLWIPREES